MNSALTSTGMLKTLCNIFVSVGLVLCFGPAYGFQDENGLVESTLKAVVGLRSVVPDSARTAVSLGTEREGNGIVIDEDGLILTIGYLILEASDVEVTNSQGQYVPAELVAYDYDSGFGLVRATQSLGIKSMPLGDSTILAPGDAALIVSHIGPEYMRVAEVADVREFPGYWEYLLDQAIFTTPPFHGFGGAALINNQGELIGVGSLMVHDAVNRGRPVPGNMFVPIDLLKPIFDDLLHSGRAAGDTRPWLGIYTAEHRGHLFVFRVANDGPAQSAGIKRDDIIVAVNGNPVSGMAEFLRAVWASGPAGVEVTVSVLRDGSVEDVTVKSGDRYDWLKIEPASRYSAMLQFD